MPDPPVEPQRAFASKATLGIRPSFARTKCEVLLRNKLEKNESTIIQKEIDMLGSSLSRARIQNDVIGTLVDVITWDYAIAQIFKWASAKESRTVCICNVHSIITARRDVRHAEALGAADMVTPDGAPVAWAMRGAGHADQRRINGPDLMWKCCETAAKTKVPMYFFGSTQATVAKLTESLRRRLPGIAIAGCFSPPFRPLSEEEDAKIVAEINASGAGIVWVGLGCPKQEAWVAQHRDRINAVMIGVGAAFDFHAGTKKRAPVWMQRTGLEWLHRLAQDPQRLTRRYISTNIIFVSALILRKFQSANQTSRLNDRTLSRPTLMLIVAIAAA